VQAHAAAEAIVKRPRRSVSIRLDTYEAAHVEAESRGVSLSSIVESYLRQLAGLDSAEDAYARDRAAEVERRRAEPRPERTRIPRKRTPTILQVAGERTAATKAAERIAAMRMARRAGQ
jgi:hypothetical protein